MGRRRNRRPIRVKIAESRFASRRGLINDMAFDAVRLEVMWNRLIAVVNEQASALIDAAVAADRPDLVSLPEMWTALGGRREDRLAQAETLPPRGLAYETS